MYNTVISRRCIFIAYDKFSVLFGKKKKKSHFFLSRFLKSQKITFRILIFWKRDFGLDFQVSFPHYFIPVVNYKLLFMLLNKNDDSI